MFPSKRAAAGQEHARRAGHELRLLLDRWGL